MAPTSRTEAIYTSHLIISRGSLPSVFSISLAGEKVLPYIGRDRFRFPTVQKLRSSVLRLLLTGTEQLPPPSLNRRNGSRGFPPNLIGSRRRERTRQLSRKLEANAHNDTSTHGSSRARRLCVTSIDLMGDTVKAGVAKRSCVQSLINLCVRGL